MYSHAEHAAHQAADVYMKNWKAQRVAVRNKTRKPIDYQKPAFNSPEYWQAVSLGWICAVEQQEDQASYNARKKRALDSKYNKANAPSRHERPAPRESKQFSKAMATTAARDDRLTPQSKALLQIITARTGNGRSTDTTKTTLGRVLNRCPRSIQRYIAELIKFGYIRTQRLKSARSGLYVAMRIWIMNKVLPAFKAQNPQYEPNMWINILENPRNSERTKESPTNIKYILNSINSSNKPPWFQSYAYKFERKA